MKKLFGVLLWTGSLFVTGGCEKTPPEIISKPAEHRNAAATQTPGGNVAAGALAPTDKAIPVARETALSGIEGSGDLMAQIDTDQGSLKCKLFEDKAPKTVSNFVALARGIQPFMDPKTRSLSKRPAYNGTIFHRIIKGFMIQGGDPGGTGGGDPGYTIPDEIWPGAKHDRAGLLCMANRGPNTNGMQFFITHDSAPHLDSGYTIFGECSPLDVVNKLANVPVMGERPETPPTIRSVTIRRGG